MMKIGDLLGRFVKLAQDSDDAKNAVLSALQSVGIKMGDIKKVSIKGSSAVIKLTAIQKNEMFLKKKRILGELAKNPLTARITEIR